ncbi:MAG: methyltransferase domain-containing protein [Planctomycetes bacterium]|nr:methyltransferase domain-containing protein [Planctomycetota bacterium]
MIEGVDFSRVSAAAEFGPGAGVFTRRVVDHLAPNAVFFAMEFNPAMAREFAHRFPNVKLHVRSAAEVREACVEEGLAPDNSLDLIISGLPWAAFPPSLQESILTAAVKALRPGGMMATFAYYQGLLLPAGKRFAASLPNYFSRVERSAPVWLNVPPAFVYRCYK